MKQEFKLVKTQKIRGCDPKGCGSYGASRGGRKHLGVDIIAVPGEKVFAPFSGTLTRHPYPYAGDTSYQGVEIVSGSTKAKIFYVRPSVAPGTKVKAGQVIGYAQDIAAKYGGASGGMTNHVHLEVYENGVNIDPTKLLV